MRTSSKPTGSCPGLATVVADMPLTGGPSVDVDALADLLQEMAACQRALVELAGDVESETTRLHGAWSGPTLDIHGASSGSWRHGFAQMAPALAGMRSASEAARQEYDAAVAADIAFWEQTR